jgi:hypothetical protein
MKGRGPRNWEGGEIQQSDIIQQTSDPMYKTLLGQKDKVQISLGNKKEQQVGLGHGIR